MSVEASVPALQSLRAHLSRASLAWLLWAGRRRSLTVLTGLKISTGTSTKAVFQKAMEPFQRPGSSRALMGLPSLDLVEMK